MLKSVKKRRKLGSSQHTFGLSRAFELQPLWRAMHRKLLVEQKLRQRNPLPTEVVDDDDDAR